MKQMWPNREEPNWFYSKITPSARWIDKKDVIHTQTHTHTYIQCILLSHKKEWNFAICNNMDRLAGHYAKWNKSYRERQILYDTLIRGIEKIQQTTEDNKKEAGSDTENKLVVSSGERLGGAI